MTQKNTRLNDFRKKLASGQDKFTIPKVGGIVMAPGSQTPGASMMGGAGSEFIGVQPNDGSLSTGLPLSKDASLLTCASSTDNEAKKPLRVPPAKFAIANTFSSKYDQDARDAFLGEGSHCVVKICRCKQTGIQYAVKMVRSEDQEMFVHCEREFKIMQRLKGHPNLVQGIEYIVEKQRGRGYIVMERILGQSILHYVHEKGPAKDEGVAKHIMRAVLSGIEYMHEMGVVHRDMNPTNVFIHDVQDCLPIVKILDFNVSKLILSGFPGKLGAETDKFDENSLDKIMKGMSIGESEEARAGFRYSMFTKTGTPLYTAPEMQLATKYSENVDCWGAGTILYLLMLGQVPFGDTQIASLMKKVSIGDYPREGPAWDALSLEVRDLILRLMCVDPSQRLSAGEALKHPWFHKVAATGATVSQTMMEID